MTDQTFVDPNTDDLDAFSSLMTGSAKPITEKPAEALSTDEEDNVLENDTTEVVDTDDDAVEDTSVEDEVKEEAPKPKRKTAQDRINELIAKNHETERALQAKIAELEAKAATPNPKTPVAPVAPQNIEGPSPTALNEDGSMRYPLGEFDPSFIRDLTRFTIESERQAADRKAAEQQQAQAVEAQRKTLYDSWNTKLEAAKTEVPDLIEKVSTLEGTLHNLNPQYSQFLAETIMGMDDGVKVLNHLASNPTEAQEIVNKGPVGAALALGRLEARFAKAETKQPPRVSAAPKPAPVTARGVAVGGQVSGDTDDLDAFSDAFFTKKKGRK